MAASALHMEPELWAASGIVPGAVVADVGCGPASVSVVLAEIVGPAGRVVAVDRDPETVETARAVVARPGADNVSVGLGEAHDTRDSGPAWTSASGRAGDGGRPRMPTR